MPFIKTFKPKQFIFIQLLRLVVTFAFLFTFLSFISLFYILTLYIYVYSLEVFQRETKGWIETYGISCTFRNSSNPLPLLSSLFAAKTVERIEITVKPFFLSSITNSLVRRGDPLLTTQWNWEEFFKFQVNLFRSSYR